MPSDVSTVIDRKIAAIQQQHAEAQEQLVNWTKQELVLRGVLQALQQVKAETQAAALQATDEEE